MGRSFISPETKRALKTTFFSTWGAYSWMSKARKNTATISIMIFGSVPTALAFRYITGEAFSPTMAWVLLALFWIPFFLSQIVVSLEMHAKKDYEDEMGAAAQVQKNLLPAELPQRGDVIFASHFEPARDVGGDYYDVISLDDDRYALVVVDVSGKGVPASLLMATLRALLREFLRREIALTDVAAQLNLALSQDTQPEQYATMFCGILDTKAKTLDYFNAGHVTPYLVSVSGELRRLETGGPPVGLLSFSQYEQAREMLAPGDRLIVYTDGVSDVAGPDGTSFTPEGLEAFITGHRQEAPGQLIASILAGVKEMSAQGEFDDDVTILVGEVT